MWEVTAFYPAQDTGTINKFPAVVQALNAAKRKRREEGCSSVRIKENGSTVFRWEKIEGEWHRIA
jgi:hypothetical protein